MPAGAKESLIRWVLDPPWEGVCLGDKLPLVNILDVIHNEAASMQLLVTVNRESCYFYYVL